MKKKNTIKKYREFQEIFNTRKFKRNEFYTIYYRKNNFDYTRIGISVSKKNGNAVIRNKIKRQVREYINQSTDYFKKIDYIIVISKKYDITKNSENKDLFIKLFTSIKENNDGK